MIIDVLMLSFRQWNHRIGWSVTREQPYLKAISCCPIQIINFVLMQFPLFFIQVTSSSSKDVRMDFFKKYINLFSRISLGAASVIHIVILDCWYLVLHLWLLLLLCSIGLVWNSLYIIKTNIITRYKYKLCI